MSKTTAPLLSFGASGAIAKTQVYASWRGIPYARRYVVPGNPNTDAQKQTRNTFGWLNQVWKLFDPSVQAPWTLFSKGRPFFNRNAFISSNLSALRGTTDDPAMDLSGMVVSPGANGGLAAANITTADDAAHGLTITLTAPALPAGWSITKAHFVALKQQAAETDKFYTSHYAFDAADPYTTTFAAIGAGTYAAFGYFEYMKPDGSTAFSPSLYHAQIVA